MGRNCPSPWLRRLSSWRQDPVPVVSVGKIGTSVARGGMGSAPHRLAGLELVRLLAALVVLAGHMTLFQLVPFPELGNPWRPPLELFRLGAVAVLVFFGLSGYVLTHGQRPSSFSGRWFARRLVRLLPLYWFALIASAVGFVVLKGSLPNLLDLAIALSTVESTVVIPGLPGFGPPALDPPLWSLSVEIWLCFLLMAIALIIVRYKVRVRRRYVAGTCVVSLGLAITFGSSSPLLVGVPFFSLGILASMSTTRALSGRATLILGAGIIAFLIVSAGWAVEQPLGVPLVVFALVTTGLAIMWGATASLGERWNRLARAGGQRTYSLYALHWPVLVAMSALLPFASPWIRFVVTLVAVAAVTEFGYRYVDRPAVRASRRITAEIGP